MRPDALAMTDARSRTADYVALTKPRLNLLVIATTAAGYYLGAGAGLDYAMLAARRRAARRSSPADRRRSTSSPSGASTR